MQQEQEDSAQIRSEQENQVVFGCWFLKIIMPFRKRFVGGVAGVNI